MDGLYKIDISGGESGKLFLKGLRCFLKQIAQIKYAPMVRRSIHPTLHDFLCSAALLPEIFGAQSHPLCWPRDSVLNSIIGNFDGTLRRETKAALFDASLLAKILRSDDYPRISLQLREMANGNFCRSRIALFVLAFYSAANPKALSLLKPLILKWSQNEVKEIFEVTETQQRLLWENEKPESGDENDDEANDEQQDSVLVIDENAYTPSHPQY